MFPISIEGPVRKIAGRTSVDGGHNYSGRLSIKRPCPEHHGCQKTRSVQLNRAEFGRLAPLVFLGAWAVRDTKSCSLATKHRGPALIQSQEA